MENVIIRNIEEKDIPSVVDIQISGWQIAYKGIIDDSTLSSMNRDERIEKRKKDYKENGFIVAELNNETYLVQQKMAKANEEAAKWGLEELKANLKKAGTTNKN